MILSAEENGTKIKKEHVKLVAYIYSQ